MLSAIGCAAALCAGAVGAPAATAQQALPPASPPDAQPLSDERSQTRWAYPQWRAKVRSRPSTRARTVTRLRLLTEDRFPEIYVALSRWTDPRGSQWVKVRLPMRPNGRTGWVPRSALAELNLVRKYIDVDKRRLRVTLYDRGRAVFSARVGVGKRGTPTPSGTYYIREKFKVRGVPLYGTHAIGTSAYAPTLSDWPGGGVVGLHGTNQPHLIPGRPSHGCIRLKNRDIARLYRLAPRGTPIHIH
ncbi:MAG TPA: L,D-transpeptidase family protein [Solirubrobacteraceae bacterium]|nr:L,D-transpeptidase family protein [Solirubrobacteraceae bacterium]